jgi:hypothetical protein
MNEGYGGACIRFLPIRVFIVIGQWSTDRIVRNNNSNL